MKCSKEDFLCDSKSLKTAIITCNSNEECKLVQGKDCEWDDVILCTGKPVEADGNERFCVWQKSNL